jgi:transitional endoplasmic reticulum ATPase
VSDATPEEQKLKVAEAFLEDVGKGFARVDADDLIKMRAAPGDVLLITGRRSTVARAVQAPPSHCGQFLIMMDGNTRNNAQAGVDEYVSVKKVPFKAANSVLLSPVQANQSVPTEEEIPHVRQLLLGLPVTIGDNVQITFLGARPRSYTVDGTATPPLPSGLRRFRPSGRTASPTRTSAAWIARWRWSARWSSFP